MAPSMLLFEAVPNLSGIPDMLLGLAPDERARVFACGQTIRFGPGDMLFRQGELHAGIFLVRSGSVRSYYTAPSGREITLANWTPGNFVGGPEIFGGGNHVWSGVATAPGEALLLSGDTVRKLIVEIPRFAVGIVEGLAFKGKCYSALLQMLGTRSVLERLAQLLVNCAELHGVPDGKRLTVAQVPTHEDMAAMVGATRQWVSATLGRFRRQGLIEIAKRQMTILDKDHLRKLASGDPIRPGATPESSTRRSHSVGARAPHPALRG